MFCDLTQILRSQSFLLKFNRMQQRRSVKDSNSASITGYVASYIPSYDPFQYLPGRAGAIDQKDEENGVQDISCGLFSSLSTFIEFSLPTKQDDDVVLDASVKDTKPSKSTVPVRSNSSLNIPDNKVKISEKGGNFDDIPTSIEILRNPDKRHSEFASESKQGSNMSFSEWIPELPDLPEFDSMSSVIPSLPISMSLALSQEEALIIPGVKTSPAIKEPVSPCTKEFKKRAGSQLNQYVSTSRPGKTNIDAINTWSTCRSDSFLLRIGPNYNWNKKKGPSPNSFYDLVGVE